LTFTKTCHICGIQFESKANNTRYCSRECRLAMKKRINIERRGPLKTYQKTCGFCGTAFETRVWNKKFCTDECYRQYHIHRKRAKRLSGLDVQSGSSNILLGLCSICGKENILVVECPNCGYLCCADCRNAKGICSVCT